MRLITKTLTALVISLAVAKAHAVESFVVEDIKVEGLQRVELGTFFTALPIRVGETLDDARVPSVIRALYKTGNFDFVKLEKDGSALKVTVVERPVISDIILSGNKIIKSDQLLENMRGSGVAKGEVLNSFVLDKIEQAITGEYFNNGHYHLDIDKQVLELSRNRVQLKIDIKEGQSAKIKAINFVGNKLYSDEELLKQMELTTGGIFSFLTDDNKYSNQILDKDLEAISNFYKDRGYLTFDVDDVLVSLSENKEDVYITVNVNEGEVFTVNDINFVGDFKLDSEVLDNITPIKKGDKYSQSITKFVEEQIKTILGLSGFTFAEVKTIPEIIKEDNEVDIIFAIEPGARYYASEINFSGNQSTDDNVFRREARLQEGTALSSYAIERTKLRLQRLPFVEEVEADIKRTDVDGKAIVDFNIKERNSSEATFSLGYNDFFGFQVQAGLTNRNFFGEGKTVGLNLNTSKAIKSINVNYSDPYFFSDEVGLSSSLVYKKTDFSKFNQIGRSLDTIGLSAGLFYPISETSSISFGFNYQDNTLKAPIINNQQDQRILDFFDDLGKDARIDSSVDFDVFSLNLGYKNSTLNRFIFPTNGYSHDVNLEYATPAGDIEYYKVGYEYKHYFPISDSGWIFLMRASLGYGEGLGDTSRLPYFVNYYAGGSASLRGFETNTVGPKSILRQLQTIRVPSPIPGGGTTTVVLPPENDQVFVNRQFSVGGNAKAIGSFELIFPTPFIEENNNVRTSFFVDVGNVWDTKFDPKRFENLELASNTISSIPDFSDPSRYRGSYGFSLQWWSPFAPLQFSLSRTFKSQQFDETKTFTFTIGQTF